MLKGTVRVGPAGTAGIIGVRPEVADTSGPSVYCTSPVFWIVAMKVADLPKTVTVFDAVFMRRMNV